MGPGTYRQLPTGVEPAGWQCCPRPLLNPCAASCCFRLEQCFSKHHEAEAHLDVLGLRRRVVEGGVHAEEVMERLGVVLVLLHAPRAGGARRARRAAGLPCLCQCGRPVASRARRRALRHRRGRLRLRVLHVARRLCLLGIRRAAMLRAVREELCRTVAAIVVIRSGVRSVGEAYGSGAS